MLMVSEEVRAAIDARHPVVALESTIIAHGLPRPRNLLVARELEETVRQEGAIPATIAVLDERPHVGLDKEQLERVANGTASASWRHLRPAARGGRRGERGDQPSRRPPSWRPWRASGCSPPAGWAACTGSGR